MIFRVVAVASAAVSALLIAYTVEAIRMHSQPPFTERGRR